MRWSARDSTIFHYTLRLLNGSLVDGDENSLRGFDDSYLIGAEVDIHHDGLVEMGSKVARASFGLTLNKGLLSSNTDNYTPGTYGVTGAPYDAPLCILNPTTTSVCSLHPSLEQ